MSAKDARGVKRSCQDSDCGSRFYDLNRDPIICPVCGSEYEIASAPFVASAGSDRSGRRTKKEYEIVQAEPDAVVADPDADDALAEVATETDEPVAGEADETFLEEEEEDGGDVSNILGGPVDGNEEET